MIPISQLEKLFDHYIYTFTYNHSTNGYPL